LDGLHRVQIVAVFLPSDSENAIGGGVGDAGRQDGECAGQKHTVFQFPFHGSSPCCAFGGALGGRSKWHATRPSATARSMGAAPWAQISWAWGQRGWN